MERILVLGALMLLVPACAADVSSNKAAGAAAAAGFGVGAAAVYRATTGGCWAQCRHGQRCDRESGTCIPLEPTASDPPPKSTATVPASTDSGGDPCRGLCLREERCVVASGVADCVRDPSAAPPTPAPRRQ